MIKGHLLRIGVPTAAAAAFLAGLNDVLTHHMSEEGLCATPPACISMGVSSVFGLSMPAMNPSAESELKRSWPVSLAAFREQDSLAKCLYSPAITAGEASRGS